jgi:hypothetical protein
MNPESTSLNAHPCYGRAILGTYGFACFMGLAGVIPGCNFSYSGHGGPAWFILPFVFPYALFRIGYGIYCGGPNREFYLGFAKITLPVYIVVAYLLSYFASMSIKSTFGLIVEELDFFKLMLVPFSLPFFEW